MTKKQMIEKMTEHLAKIGRTVIVKDFGYELRSGYGGMKAYEIKVYRDELCCYPWAGANVLWTADFRRLRKAEIETIYNRVMNVH